MTDSTALTEYIAEGWDLIPLHRWDAQDVFKGKTRQRGKSPRDKNWTKRVYKAEDQLDHMDSGGNVGVRLHEKDLIIDVDPRNFPEGQDLESDENPFVQLCKDTGLDPDECPTVITGSGGLHVYLRKPSDVAIRDSLSDAYPGIEFKSKGRQVVAAGSKHPDTEDLYVWDGLNPILSEGVPKAPKRLIELIKRPDLSESMGGGEYDQEQIAHMLDALDPEDFRDHEKWLQLMMAVHHATKGDARSEFVEWSTRDPRYSDHGLMIGARWDSLHSDNKGNRTTYKTLLKFLHDADAHEVIPRDSAEDDFDFPEDDLGVTTRDPDEEELPEHETRHWGEQLNEKYWTGIEGGKFRVFYEYTDPTEDDRYPSLQSMAKSDFLDLYADRRVERGNGTIPIAQAWLEWPGHRKIMGVVFDPEKVHPGYLNLWRGWGVDPAIRSWDYLGELIEEVLSAGDEKIHKYILDWCAFLVQNPGDLAETAICFTGGMGVGKGTLGRALLHISGRHGAQMTSSDSLTGQFTGSLVDKVFVFSDEAIKPHDRKGISQLNGLITEPKLLFRKMYRDAFMAKNRSHIMMASNEFAIPIEVEGDRRYMLQEATNARQGNHDFFNKLNRELYGPNQGIRGFFHSLLTRNIEGFHPRNQIPTSSAAVEQKIRNMSPMAEWWFKCLDEAEPPGDILPDLNHEGKEIDWWNGPIRVMRCDVKDSFSDFCRQIGVKPEGNSRALEMAFGREISELIGPDLRTDLQVLPPENRDDVMVKPSNGRTRGYRIPSLLECRKHMESMLKGAVAWTEIMPYDDELGF